MKKLKIEMIPKTMQGVNARVVLANYSNNPWYYVKSLVHKHNKYKCEVCNVEHKKSPLECHEVWDYSDGYMKLVKLQSLCRNCHLVKHYDLALFRSKLPVEECLSKGYQPVDIKHLNNHIKRVHKIGFIRLFFAVKIAQLKAHLLDKQYKLDLTLLNHSKYSSIRKDVRREFTNNENAYCKKKLDELG